MKAKISQGRGKEEQAGQEVLSFDDPGHRFDLERVHSEEESHPPSAWDLDPLKQPPKQTSIEALKEEVGQVIAEGVQFPDLELKPKRCIDHRPVMALRGMRGFGPDPFETFESAEILIEDNSDIIIPDKPAEQGG